MIPRPRHRHPAPPAPKAPIDENPDDDYDFQPVTGIFTHTAGNVLQLVFGNADTLGVTAAHPFYSITAAGWRLAGELETGEEILTKSGSTFLVASSAKPGMHPVWNLEVKDDHNFLVGDGGLVVHNAYTAQQLRDYFDKGINLATDISGKVRGALDELATWTKSQRDKFINDFGDVIPLELGRDGVRAWEALYKTGLRTDVNLWLPTVSKWIDEGVTYVDNVLPVKFLHNGNEIARIVDDKLIPKKFQFDGEVVNEVKLPGQTHGKELVKSADGTICFRYQFQKTKMYGAMSNAEWQAVQSNNGLSIGSGTENFVSTSRAYSKGYVG